jgi:DNA-binding response OmpR family regulator
MTKSVLIVDDEEEIVDFMEKFLRRCRIRSMKATCGEAAVRMYTTTEVSMVFLDIHMGDMDGFSVLKQLKETDPSAKIIMITGCSDNESREKAIALGALDYITKPLDLSDLRSKVEKYILSETI